MYACIALCVSLLRLQPDAHKEAKTRQNFSDARSVLYSGAGSTRGRRERLAILVSCLSAAPEATLSPIMAWREIGFFFFFFLCFFLPFPWFLFFFFHRKSKEGLRHLVESRSCNAPPSSFYLFFFSFLLSGLIFRMYQTRLHDRVFAWDAFRTPPFISFDVCYIRRQNT